MQKVKLIGDKILTANDLYLLNQEEIKGRKDRPFTNFRIDYIVHYSTRKDPQGFITIGSEAVDNKEEAIKLAMDTMSFRKSSLQAVEVNKIKEVWKNGNERLSWEVVSRLVHSYS